MNEVIRGIASRRTIKRMEPDKLPPRTDIELIIEAATWAPNHHSTEPWRFVVLEGDSRKQLGQVLAAALAMHSTGPVPIERLEKEKEKPLSAPVIVALIGSPKKGEGILPQEEMVALGAALQNMLLAAHSLGLATSVRTGEHSYTEEVRRFFSMDESEMLVGLVYVGYQSGPAAAGRRVPFRDRTTWLT